GRHLRAANGAPEPLGIGSAHVVVDQALPDVRLELLERRSGIAAVEATDREDRCLARERQPGRVVRSGRGRCPAIAGRVVLEGRDEVAAGLPGIEQATEVATSTRPASEAAEPAATGRSAAEP